MTVQPPAERPAPGYYPDPSIPGFIRYWDGHVWTPGSARPAPVDGAPMPPPPRTGSRGGVQVAPPPPPRQEVRAVEETGPVFLDETGAASLIVPGAEVASDATAATAAAQAPRTPSSVWGASPESQRGLLDTDAVPRLSWGVPDQQPAAPAAPAARAGVTPGASEVDADEELASALRLALTQTRRAQLPPPAHYESPVWPDQPPATAGLPAAPVPGAGRLPDLDWAADGPALAEAAPPEPGTPSGGAQQRSADGPMPAAPAAGTPQQSGSGWTVGGPMPTAPAASAGAPTGGTPESGVGWAVGGSTSGAPAGPRPAAAAPGGAGAGGGAREPGSGWTVGGPTPTAPAAPAGAPTGEASESGVGWAVGGSTSGAPAGPRPAAAAPAGAPAGGAGSRVGGGWTVGGPMPAAPALRAAERQVQGRAPEIAGDRAPASGGEAAAAPRSVVDGAAVVPATPVTPPESAVPVERPAPGLVPGSVAGSARTAEPSSAGRSRLEPNPEWPPRETPTPAPASAPSRDAAGAASRTKPGEPPAAPAAPAAGAALPGGVPTAGLSAAAAPGRTGTAAGATARNGAGARRQRAPRPALLGPRIGARLIDIVVAYALVGVLGVVLVQRVVTHLQGRIDAARASGLPQTVWLVDWTVLADAGILLGALLAVGVVYEAIPTAVWGRTLGKASLGLVVLDAKTRARPSLGQALLRTALCQTFVFLLVGILELVPCAADRRLRQSWHDRLSRTFVAKR